MSIVRNVVVAVLCVSKCFGTVSPETCQLNHQKFKKCVFDYYTFYLHCDYTVLTQVPDFDDSLIDTQVNASEARGIFINESCLENIDGNVLSHYPHLSILNCAGNRISNIRADVFTRNRNLTTLILSRNRIRLLRREAFAGIINLQQLDLSGNLLQKVGKLVFARLDKVRTLDLSNNLISEIDSEAFWDIQKLEVLNLNGNRLTEIDSHFLNGMRQLWSINLGNNKLTTLPDGLFKGSKAIHVIDLSYNNITCLSEDLLQNRRNVSVLRLNGNNLQVPEAKWYRDTYHRGRREEGAKNMLSHNPWRCDCNTYQYWSFLDDTDSSWKELFDVVCFLPLNRQNRSLSSLSEDDFKGCSVSMFNHSCKNAGYIPFPYPKPSSKSQEHQFHHQKNLDESPSESQPTINKIAKESAALEQPSKMIKVKNEIEGKDKQTPKPLVNSTDKETITIPKQTIFIAAGAMVIIIVLSLVVCYLKKCTAKKYTKKKKENDLSHVEMDNQRNQICYFQSRGTLTNSNTEPLLKEQRPVTKPCNPHQLGVSAQQSPAYATEMSNRAIILQTQPLATSASQMNIYPRHNSSCGRNALPQTFAPQNFTQNALSQNAVFHREDQEYHVDEPAQIYRQARPRENGYRDRDSGCSLTDPENPVDFVYHRAPAHQSSYEPVAEETVPKDHFPRNSRSPLYDTVPSHPYDYHYDGAVKIIDPYMNV